MPLLSEQLKRFLIRLLKITGINSALPQSSAFFLLLTTRRKLNLGDMIRSNQRFKEKLLTNVNAHLVRTNGVPDSI